MSNSNWHGGKGSKQRPTDREKYNDNYDAIFGKKTAVDDAADVMSGMWTHNCKVDGLISTEKGSKCNWCDAEEEE